MKKYWKIILLILSPFIGGLMYKLSMFITIPEFGSTIIGIFTCIFITITIAEKE